jgi:oxalate decarboxylase/phosphoglucose isomerase-like protein (cupin superfamily)
MKARSDFYRETRDVETLEFGWGRVNITASPEVCSAKALSARVVVLKPGCGHERHKLSRRRGNH